MRPQKSYYQFISMNKLKTENPCKLKFLAYSFITIMIFLFMQTKTKKMLKKG